MAETEMEMTSCHGREMEKIGARQIKVVSALEYARRPAEFSKETLAVMHRTLDLGRDHAARLSNWDTTAR